jgi:hypothetical protein
MRWWVSSISLSACVCGKRGKPRSVGAGEGGGKVSVNLCTSSDLMEPFDPISKRHFSAGDLSSLTC